MVPIIGSDYPKLVIPLIDGARNNIDIAVYDWRWYANDPGHSVQQFNIAVVNARKRGVQVRILLNSDILLPLLEELGMRVRILSDHRTLHVKLLMVDRKYLVIGSHNITRNAFTSNLEASVLLDIPPEVTRFAEFFENLYNI